MAGKKVQEPPLHKHTCCLPAVIEASALKHHMPDSNLGVGEIQAGLLTACHGEDMINAIRRVGAQIKVAGQVWQIVVVNCSTKLNTLHIALNWSIRGGHD